MPAKSLRVLTYNLKLLPGLFGRGDHDRARAEGVVSRILATEPAWDVLCLQEVFDEEARGDIARRLKSRYPYQVSKSSDSDIFHEDSGLFFASRYPVTGSRFVEFQSSSGNDRLADKGVFGARLNVSGTTVLVFNTHLQASVKYSTTRVRQSRQLRRFVHRTLRTLAKHTELASVVAIACGDFNVVGEHVAVGDAPIGYATSEYAAIIGWLGWPRDLFRETHPTDPGFTWDGSRNTSVPRTDKERQRLDYVFAWDTIPAAHDDDAPPALCPASVRQIAVERFETATANDCLSDHFAVDATLAIHA